MIKKGFLIVAMICSSVLSMEKSEEQKKENQEETTKKISDGKEELIKLAHDLQRATWEPRRKLLELTKPYEKELDDCVKEYDHAVQFLYQNPNLCPDQLKKHKEKIAAAFAKVHKVDAEIEKIAKLREEVRNQPKAKL